MRSAPGTNRTCASGLGSFQQTTQFAAAPFNKPIQLRWRPVLSSVANRKAPRRCDDGRMVAEFTVDTFAHRVGECFRIRLDSGDSLEATLVEASELGPALVAEGRVPFSLVFLGPTEPVLPQRIYRVEHAELGALDIFLVPLGPDDVGQRYEAVFT